MSLALLTIDGLPAPQLGTIRWCRGQRAGLSFDSPLAPDDMRSLLMALS
jgi:hypothetical protein